MYRVTEPYYLIIFNNPKSVVECWSKFDIFSAKYIHKGWRVVVYALLHKGVTFSQCDWFIPWKERFWLAITTQNIYLNNSEWSEMTVKMNFLYSGNYNFNHQLLQIFKQNYDHFAVKPTICICNGSAMEEAIWKGQSTGV